MLLNNLNIITCVHMKKKPGYGYRQSQHLSHVFNIITNYHSRVCHEEWVGQLCIPL